MAHRFKHGTEEYYRNMYLGMSDDSIYPLLVVANAKLDKTEKELKSILIRKCKHLASQSKEEATYILNPPTSFVISVSLLR